MSNFRWKSYSSSGTYFRQKVCKFKDKILQIIVSCHKMYEKFQFEEQKFGQQLTPIKA